MEIQIRPADPHDAEAVGRIQYDAFKCLAERHGFRPDFSSVESAVGFMRTLLGDRLVHGLIAEHEGEIAGVNFLHEHNEIRGVGPIAIVPSLQGSGIGRQLMQAAIVRGREAPGIRLVQDAFNMASLSLYAGLGFAVREPLVEMEGRLAAELPPGYEVTPMREQDLHECAELCQRVLGFDRAHEIKAFSAMLNPFVALRGGRIVAYLTAPTFWPLNHGVAEDLEAMQALLAGAGAANADPLSLLLPTRQEELFRWCLERGLRAIKPATLMSLGRWQEPQGYYFPSVYY